MITMTPEEYEAKYGVPPPTASTRQNTPMRTMTQDEYNAKFNPQKVKPFKFDVPVPEFNRQNKIQEYKDEAKKYQEEADRYSFSLKNMTMKKNPFMALGTYANQVAGDFFSGARAVKNDLAQSMNINAGGADGFVDAEKTNGDTKVSLLRRIRENETKGVDSTKLKQLYNIAVDDGEKLNEKVKSITTQPSTLKTSADLVMMAVEVLSVGTFGSSKGALAGMKSGKLTGKLPTAIQAIVDNANAPAGIFTKKGMQRIAEGGMFGYAYDVASGFAGQRGPEREGSGAFIPGAVTALGLGFPGFIAGSRSLSRVATKAGREGVTSEKRLAGLDQLERDNRQVRDTFNRFRERTYRDPSDILSHSSALNDAVDKNGTIDMTTPMSELRSMIDQEDTFISDYLKTEGTTIGGANYVGGLFDGLRDTELQLGDRLSLQKEIRRLADNVDQFTDINGKIDLWKIQKAKVDLGQRIGKKWNDADKDVVNKELYRIYMKTVEKYTKGIDVKQHNKGLSDAYELMKVFQVLNGKKVEGGRLGKHVSSTIGAVIGMSTGNPLVAFAGAGAGRAIRGQQLKRAFGGKVSRPFAKTGETPRKKTSTKRTKIDDIKKKTFVTKLKDKVNQERVKNRSLMRQPGASKRGFASLGGTEPKLEPERKLVVNAGDLNVNDKMQIIDETKTGAEALVGTVGNLSPELRTAVIKAVKSKDQVTLNKLVPQIAEELRAKAERQSRATQLTPEQTAQNRLLKTQERLSEFKKDTKTLDIGLSPVEGTKRTQWSDAHDEAMTLFNSGDVNGAYRKFSEIHTGVVSFIKKRIAGAPFEKDISFKDIAFGVFEGKPEINVGMTAKIKDTDMEMFHQFLIDVSKRDLYQKSVLTYKHQPHSDNLPYGVVDKAKGITRDPLWSFFPTEPLTLPQVKLFNEALAEAGLQFMSLKDGGKRVDILDLTAYNGNYEQFVTKISDLKEALDRKGLTGSSELGGTETRLIGDETESQNITYERSKRDFLKNNPSALTGEETIDSPILDALRYRTSMPKSEFQQLLNTAGISPVEKKVYEDVIRKYPDTAQINPQSLYKLLLKKTLKMNPGGEMSSYVGYGWSRLFKNEGDYEFKTQKIDTNLPISLDGTGVLHVSSGDVAQFGHFRYATRDKNAFIGETQNDPFQQSSKFGMVKNKIENGNGLTREHYEEEISRSEGRRANYQNQIDEARREIEESRAGNDMNHRVIREGRYILAQLNDWVAEKGLNTNVLLNEEGAKTYGDNFAWVVGIHPAEEGGVKGYSIQLAWKLPGTGEGTGYETKFIRSSDQGEPIVGQAGLNYRLEINESPKTGRVSLKNIIDERESSLEENTERFIRDREESISNDELGIKDMEQKIKDAKKAMARLKKPKDNLQNEQYLNFKRNDIFVKRQLQEEIEFLVKSEKPKRIYLPTPSTTAKIEGYFPSRRREEAPTYSYEGSFGEGAPDLKLGEQVQVSGQRHTVIYSHNEHVQTVPSNSLEKIFLPAGKIKRNRFIKEKFKERELALAKYQIQAYATSDNMKELGENLTLDTMVDENTAALIYSHTRGAVDRAFSQRGNPAFFHTDRTIGDILDNYLSRVGVSPDVVHIAFAEKEGGGRIFPVLMDDMVMIYDAEKIYRHKQPSRLKPAEEESFESQFDASKQVIMESMNGGSSEDVVLHRFDDIKKVYPELERQFGQKLTPETDEHGNTWLYFTPQYNEPQWKYIKKTTF